MTFVSDSPIQDQAFNGDGVVSGNLWMRDGTRYRIDQGGVTSIRDRNGNKVSISGVVSPPYALITSGTDSLNRQVSFEYNVSDIAPYGLCDRVRFKGASGAERIIRISKTTLSNALRTTQPGDSSTVRTYQQLFPLSNVDGDYNPIVYSAVWLPDGRSYQFKYNVYGELARVTLPTGGASEYDFLDMGTVSGVGTYAVYRRLIARRVYPDGGVGAGYERLTTYSEEPPVPGSNGNIGSVVVNANH
jgi:YD repeat-containing protein